MMRSPVPARPTPAWRMPWRPRYDGLLFWAALILMALAAAGLYRAAAPRAVRTPPQAPPAPAAGEEARIEHALRQLAALSGREAAWGGSIRQARQGDGPLIDTSPPVPARVSPADGVAEPAAGAASLVLMQVGRRFTAQLGGKPIRVGQLLDSGETVTQIGATFVVLTPPGGLPRRLDMADRFMPRPASSSPKEIP